MWTARESVAFNGISGDVDKSYRNVKVCRYRKDKFFDIGQTIQIKHNKGGNRYG